MEEAKEKEGEGVEEIHEIPDPDWDLVKTRTKYACFAGSVIFSINFYLHAQSIAAEEIKNLPATSSRPYERSDQLRAIYTKVGNSVVKGFFVGVFKFGALAFSWSGIDYLMKKNYDCGILNYVAAGFLTSSVLGFLQGGVQGFKIAVPIVTGISLGYGVLERSIDYLDKMRNELQQNHNNSSDSSDNNSGINSTPLPSQPQPIVEQVSSERS